MRHKLSYWKGKIGTIRISGKVEVHLDKTAGMFTFAKFIVK
jgi:hypothetical protein